MVYEFHFYGSLDSILELTSNSSSTSLTYPFDNIMIKLNLNTFVFETYWSGF